jgi:hypothetical protein
LQAFETTPNVPPLNDTASSRVLAVTFETDFFESSSVEPISIQSSANFPSAMRHPPIVGSSIYK